MTRGRDSEVRRAQRAAARQRPAGKLIGVEGLLPELTFFEHLANRRFPVTWWIRRPEQLDYLAEPDLFHDLFGHVPLLMNPVFADYMQAYGRGGVKAHGIGPEALVNLTRLYWYTVEFGLINSADGLRIYGAGIVSSKGERCYCLESPAPNRIGFDLRADHAHALPHRHLPEDLFRHRQLRAADGGDAAGLRADLRATGVEGIAAGRLHPGDDKVYQRGSGEGWANDADV